MARRPGHLRTRLLIAMGSVALGAIVLTGVGTFVLARQTAADAAQDELEEDAPRVAVAVEDLRDLAAQFPTAAGPRSPFRTLYNSLLRIADGKLVAVTEGGDVIAGVDRLLGRSIGQPDRDPTLGDGLPSSDLDTDAMLSGETQVGRDGDVAFIAVPLDPIEAPAGGVPVLVMTQQIEANPLGRAGPFFVVAGALALVVAVLVSAYLARHLTRPLAAMEATTGAIASGDLSARVPVTGRPDDELARLARAIDGMAGQLEVARGAERAFLLSVSHDLRTPLTSIQGYADAIADGTVSQPEDLRRAADIIGAESRRLARLVADLLDLARLDAREFSLTPVPVDAREVVEQTVEGFRLSASEHGVELRLVAGSPIASDVDPVRLAQIVANLVENALKYAADRVDVVVGSNDGNLVLTVVDDGPGITPADLPHVFERLYASRRVTGRAVGTGLGLAIVRELASAMGGAADVERGDGDGTCFVVRLPVVA
jgi:two-component system OmpR family sensor kinase